MTTDPARRPAAIAARGLRKSFGTTTVLDGIDLHVPAGTVFALVLTALALIWLAVALGLQARSVETASNTPMFLVLLPFLGSGFVPTDSMPAALRWFAAYQPFTPIIETLRGLLLGTPIGANGVAAVAWCLVIAGGGYLWSRRLYEGASVRPRV